MENKKIKTMAKDKFFFILYLVLFGISLFLASMSDVIFPFEIQTFRGEEHSMIYFSEGILKVISMIHMIGGVAFFVVLCVRKIEDKE